MKSLEEIVKKLEMDIPLEESIKLYKQGVEMAIICREKIDAVEKEVMELKKSFDGNFYLEPFDIETEENEFDTE